MQTTLKKQENADELKLILNNYQKALDESPSHKNTFSDSFKAGVPTQA